MKLKQGVRLLCLLLSCLLVVGFLPSQAQAAEPAGVFVLTVEAGGKLVVAPEYITYTEGQTLGEALESSGHTFTGLEQGQVTAIDGVTGNYTRSDQNGGYDLSVPASSVTHFCFSERSSSESKPNEGLLLLMTAMADYLEKEEDVRKAAKAEYDTAKQHFVGASYEDAKMLASDLNKAIQNYEAALAGTKYAIRFTDGSKAYSASNYPGVSLVAENPYGKVWTDEGDGTLELTAGEYTFCVEQNGLRVEGPVSVSGNQTVTVELPDDLWLKLDAFRLSGTYGEDDNEEKRFVDGELEVGQWDGRTAKVAVPDLFTGAVYTYAEYDTAKLNKVPTLTAIYTLASTGNQMENELTFGSKTVGAYGTLTVTHDSSNALVIIDGEESYAVQQSGDGGTAEIIWTLDLAPVNSSINTGLSSSWPNFRGSNTNNAVTNVRIPTVAEEGTLYWANQIGSGIDSDAVGSPILVGGDVITYASNKLFRVDTVTGEILATGYMDHKSSFSITPPTYAEGMVFVALSDGCVQAFNATTLESLWIYKDPLGGQPNCPLTVKNGYLYTGFWNSETGDANFVCMSITDEDPTEAKETKPASWYYTSKGGYYWAGAYAGDGFVLVGTDDGDNSYVGQTSRLLLLEAKTGRVLDSWDNMNGDIRSTIVYDSATNAYYFTSKGGSFYSVQVSGGNTLTNMWSVSLQNGTGGTPMSTCSPVVYNGRAYVGVSGAGQFTAYSGHNITVVDLASRSIAYSVPTQGYPQTSGLLTTAYEAESGYVYVYFFDNYTPGKLRVLRDKPGMTAADYTNVEKNRTTAYALFTPTGDQAQYAICSPVIDEYGTIYFKNDSAHLMAFGSAIEKIEVITAPDKTSYVAGETFDPTGMVVIATYANGKTRDITRYVSWSEEPLTTQDAAFTISFEHVMYHNQEEGTEMISGVVSKTPTVTLELTIMDGTLGDVNNDGMIDLADAQMILDYEAKLLNRELRVIVADVSGDGVIDSNDAVLIQQYLAGKFDKFPAEKSE